MANTLTGLTCTIYRDDKTDCSNGGISSRVKRVIRRNEQNEGRHVPPLVEHPFYCTRF